jgi:uncharacterized membrane protein YagU involved in acid resistance
MRVDGRGLLAGAVGGVAGGVLFGAMMTVMGMMGMVAGLVGSESVVVGWLVHLAISVVFGAAYALVLGALTRSYGRGVGLGAIYGVAVWVVGPLLIMPVWMGMPPLMIGEPQVMSLIGHLLFGGVTGLVYRAVVGSHVTTHRVQA